MTDLHVLRRALGCVATALVALSVSAPLYAQDDDSGSNDDAIEEIVVTGSRIKRANLVSTSPVTQVDSDEFLFQGITRIEDLLNDLPQVLPSQSSMTNNGASGTATVDLRGVEAIRTLTLLNLRLPQQVRCALTCSLANGVPVSSDNALSRGSNASLAVLVSQRFRA